MPMQECLLYHQEVKDSPNALAEAMTAGCCCIAFDFVAGPNEMITNGVDGILVPSGDTQKLVEAIDDLIVKMTLEMYLLKKQ